MNDRELLELAAKAAGIETRPQYASMENGYGLNVKPGYYWNPLTDDGDALRLAVKLEMCLDLAQEGENTFDHLGLRANAVCHDTSHDKEGK